MADRFGNFSDSLSSPASSAVAVTPHDANPLPGVSKALYVGTGGDIVLRGRGDSADSTWKNVPSGAILPIRVTHIRASGTSAADILALS